MDFLNKITISEISHASIVEFKTGEKADMVCRPWNGVAFSLGGALVYIHNHTTIPLQNNSIVYLPRDSTYHIRCTHGGSFAVINFQEAEDISPRHFKATESSAIDTIRSVFFTMNPIFLRGFTEHRAEILSYAYKIFSLIADHASQSFSPILNHAILYIEQNLENPQLSNHSIAKELYISEVYLRKLFANTLSVSVKQYILDKRIEKARALLAESTLSVTEISQHCGYANVYYFSRSFKEKTGMSPMEFVKKYRVLKL